MNEKSIYFTRSKHSKGNLTNSFDLKMTDLVESSDSSKAEGGFGRTAEELQNGDSRCQVFGGGVLQLHDSLGSLIDHHFALVAQAALDEVKHGAARPEADSRPGLRSN